MKLIPSLLEQKPCYLQGILGHEFNGRRICCQEVNNSRNSCFPVLIKSSPEKENVMTLVEVKFTVFSDRSTFVFTMSSGNPIKMPNE